MYTWQSEPGKNVMQDKRKDLDQPYDYPWTYVSRTSILYVYREDMILRIMGMF